MKIWVPSRFLFYEVIVVVSVDVIVEVVLWRHRKQLHLRDSSFIFHDEWKTVVVKPEVVVLAFLVPFVHCICLCRRRRRFRLTVSVERAIGGCVVIIVLIVPLVVVVYVVMIAVGQFNIIVVDVVVVVVNEEGFRRRHREGFAGSCFKQLLHKRF